MAANIATVFSDLMTTLTTNQGGQVQSLPAVNRAGGKERFFTSILTLNGQTSGTIIAVARIPVPFVFLGIAVLPGTSLGSSTIQFGSPGNFSGSANYYGASSTVTSTTVPTGFANAASYGQEIDTGYDCQSGLATSYSRNNGFGGAYEDVVMTIGTATFPSGGGTPATNLIIVVKYAID